MNHIKQAKQILNSINFVSMATVNEDGSPLNSPLFFIYDKNFDYIYWGSHPDSLHSKNILRTGQAYFTAFDAINGKYGVYIRADEGQIVKDVDLVTALKIHNRFRAKLGKDAIDIFYYQGESPQKMWRAKVKQIWINAYKRRKDGRLIKDYKIEINPNKLISLWSY